MTGNDRLILEIREVAKKTGVDQKEVAKQLIAAFEDVSLQFAIAMVKSGKEDDDSIVSKSWSLTEKFAAEKMKRGDMLMAALEES